MELLRDKIAEVSEGKPHVLFKGPWSAGALGPAAFVEPVASEWREGERAILVQTGGVGRVTLLGAAPAPRPDARYRVRDFGEASVPPDPPPRVSGVANMARAEAAALLAGQPSSSSYGDKCLQLALIAHGAPAGIAKFRTLKGRPPQASPRELDRLRGKPGLAKLGEELCNFLLEDDTKS